MPSWFGKKLRIALLIVVAVTLAGGGLLFYRIQKYGPPSKLQLHAMNPDGSSVQLLSKSISITGGPASWSPDGKDVVFEKRVDICIISPDGSDERCLTKGPERDELPQFSPDGSKIAFSSESSGELGIWVMNPDGSSRKQLSNNTDWNPHWSPDGSKIAFTSGRKGKPGIYLINPDGSEEVRLTKSKHESAGQYSEDDVFSWSPDGSKIAFQSTREGGPAIYTMDADGTNQKRLVGRRPGKDEDANSPAWSPDGELIAFERGLGSTFEIWVIRPDGSGLRRLTDDKFADIGPSWSPDGRTITFMSARSL